MSRSPLAAALLVCLSLLVPASALGQATLLSDLGGPDGFGNGVLNPSDDGSTDPIDLSSAFPDGLNLFGTIYDSIFVNNNGNISFAGPVPWYEPAAFPISDQPMIAPWWGDVDTRISSAGIANKVYWTIDETGSRFVVTWYEVGYFSLHTDLANSFQVILTDRSDVEAGDFDVEFRYNRCEWSQGDRTSTGGGAVDAQAGFDAGDGAHFYSLPGSMTPNVLRLCETSNVDEDGVWRFNIRIGDITTCGNDRIDTGEDCDEGGVTATCDGDCTAASCPDGYRNEVAGEECDDGNADNGDGCSGACSVEEGWDCRLDIDTGGDLCIPICGDGRVLGDETCDDGNANDGDGCSSTCFVEDGYICDDGEPSECFTDRDGDGITDPDDNCPDTPNPAQMDLDGDGIGDACDPDRDNDDLTNPEEDAIGTDPDDADTDDGGIPDGEEWFNDADPFDPIDDYQYYGGAVQSACSQAPTTRHSRPALLGLVLLAGLVLLRRSRA